MVLLSIGGAACSPSGATRPNVPTVAEARGGETCRAVDSFGSPLIVDWKMEQRTDLEAALGEGVVVVHYDCRSLRMLPKCSIAGSYGFVGVTKKQQVIRLEDTDELRANLPTFGPKMAVSLEAEFARGMTLDVALVMVGKRTTPRRALSHADLPSGCAEATHFVRSATVGAFAVRSGSKSRMSTVADVFTISAKGESASSKIDAQQDGSLDKCVDVPASLPVGCGAPLRLELAPIEDEPPPNEGAETFVAAIETCPEGMAMIDGKCAKKTGAKPHACKLDDVADCAEQCKLGHAGSCGNLGVAYANGRGVAKDEARAAALFKQACDGGEPSGCLNLGFFHAKGIGVAKDEARAAALYERACEGGNPRGCHNLGWFYETGRGVAKDEARAALLYERACDGGDLSGLNNLGILYQDGRGVAKDEARAAVLFEKACEGGNPSGCNNLGDLYLDGRGVAKDEARAVALYERACKGGSPAGCESLKSFGK